MADFDFSHLNTQQTTNQKPNDFDFSHLNSNNNTTSADTGFSFFPKTVTPEFQTGTPENKGLIDNLINSYAGDNAFGLVGEGIAGAGKVLNNAFKDISPLEQKAIESKQEFKNLGIEQKEIQGQGKTSGLPTDLNTAQGQALQSQQKLNDLQESLGDKPPTLPKNVDEAQTNLDKAQSDHETANNLSDETENNLSTHLKKGIDYDVEAANRIKTIGQANRKGISNGYDELTNDWKDREVPIDNTSKIQDKNNELMDLIKSGGARSPEANSILDELKGLEDEKSTNASDYLTVYRSVSQYAREARQKAYQPGMNAEQRAEWKDKYDTLDSKVDEMGKTLEGSVGPDEFQKLKDLNNRWRTEVVPLHQNRIYQNIVKNGTMSDNIIKSLRGTNKGNVILRNIVQNDPELLKTVVGQRYAVKPSEVLNPTDRIKPYSDLMPDMNQLRDQHLSAKDAVDSSKQALDQAVQSHKEISSNADEYASKRQEIEDTQNKLGLLDKHVENLRQIASRKGLSLKEKDAAERAYSIAKKAQSDARYKLKVGGYIGLSALGAGGLRYVGKLLSPNQESIENK